jgi:hypothetical protein
MQEIKLTGAEKVLYRDIITFYMTYVNLSKPEAVAKAVDKIVSKRKLASQLTCKH